jgi:hypothetical protein
LLSRPLDVAVLQREGHLRLGVAAGKQRHFGDANEWSGSGLCCLGTSIQAHGPPLRE